MMGKDVEKAAAVTTDQAAINEEEVDMIEISQQPSPIQTGQEAPTTEKTTVDKDEKITEESFQEKGAVATTTDKVVIKEIVRTENPLSGLKVSEEIEVPPPTSQSRNETE